MSPRAHRALAPVLALLVGACTVGPDYAAPGTPVPDAWRGEAPAAGADEEALAAWWTAFRDPALDALVSQALSQNLDLAAARARVAQARALLVQADAIDRPQVGASASATRSKASENAFGGGSGAFVPPGQTSNNYGVGLDAAWELDLFGGARREAEAATADLGAAVADERGVQVTLVAEVADAYLQLRAAERRLRVAREAVTARGETADLVASRRDGGLATDLDVERARAQWEDARAAVPPQQAARGLAGHRLDVLLGRAPGATLDALDAPSDEAALPDVPIGLPSELLRRRPDVVRAERRLAAATARIGVAEADRFPRVDLSAAGALASTSTATLFERDSRAWSLGLGLSVPILDGGRRRAEVDRAQAAAEEALAGYRLAVLTALRETEDALLGVARERERAEALARAEAGHARATEMARDLYGSGLTDFLDVLQAETDLYAAQDALAVSEREVARGLVALYKAVGGGWMPRSDP